LEKQNAIYPYNGHRIYDYLVKASGSTYNECNAFPGCFPKLVIMGLVDHNAYKGDYALSPWNFQHFDVNSIGLRVNGNWVPHEPYQPDYTNKLIAREYMMLFMALGKAGLMNDDNALLQSDFVGGNALYAFVLAPDMCLSGHAQPARLSPIAVEIKFAKNIPKALQLICFCVYDTKFEVSANRNVELPRDQAAN